MKHTILAVLAAVSINANATAGHRPEAATATSSATATATGGNVDNNVTVNVEGAGAGIEGRSLDRGSQVDASSNTEFVTPPGISGFGAPFSCRTGVGASGGAAGGALAVIFGMSDKQCDLRLAIPIAKEFYGEEVAKRMALELTGVRDAVESLHGQERAAARTYSPIGR